MKRLVFVDSSEFIAANFYFQGGRLRALISRMVEGEITLGMPRITRKELHAYFIKQMGIAADRIRAMQKELRLLRIVNDTLPKSLFSEVDTSVWSNQLVERLEKTLKSAAVVDLAADDIDVAHVFELYFGNQAPFANADKKNEFPDAFSLAIVSAWGERERATVFIASTDDDVIQGAQNYPHLEYVGNLAQLLARVASEVDESLAGQAKAHFAQLNDTIGQEIETQFPNLGFFLDDQEGDVNDVSVDSVELDPKLVNVEREGENVRATFDVSVVVQFTAAITYDDMDTAIYDHEDGCAYALDQVNTEVEREDEFDVSIEVVFPATGNGKVSFELDWTGSRDVSVTAIPSEDFS